MSSSTSQLVGRNLITPFFMVSAVLEVGAGVALLAVPDLAIRLVFGTSGTEAGIALGRLAGGALLALGAACWLARHDGISAASRALVIAMLTYNAAVVALVLAGSFGSIGVLLASVALLHGGMAVWCLPLLKARR